MTLNRIKNRTCLCSIGLMVFAVSLLSAGAAAAIQADHEIHNDSSHSVTFLVEPDGSAGAVFSSCSAGTTNRGWCTVPPKSTVTLSLSYDMSSRSLNRNFNIRAYVDQNTSTELQYTISYAAPGYGARCGHISYSPMNGSSPLVTTTLIGYARCGEPPSRLFIGNR